MTLVKFGMYADYLSIAQMLLKYPYITTHQEISFSNFYFTFGRYSVRRKKRYSLWKLVLKRAAHLVKKFDPDEIVKIWTETMHSLL